jgi:hypothetical protein
MKNENKPNGAAAVTPQESQTKEVGIMDMFQKIEKLLARANSLSLAMLKELHSVDSSLAILAGQRKRELDQQQSVTEAR